MPIDRPDFISPLRLRLRLRLAGAGICKRTPPSHDSKSVIGSSPSLAHTLAASCGLRPPSRLGSSGQQAKRKVKLALPGHSNLNSPRPSAASPHRRSCASEDLGLQVETIKSAQPIQRHATFSRFHLQTPPFHPTPRLFSHFSRISKPISPAFFLLHYAVTLPTHPPPSSASCAANHSNFVASRSHRIASQLNLPTVAQIRRPQPFLSGRNGLDLSLTRHKVLIYYIGSRILSLHGFPSLFTTEATTPTIQTRLPPTRRLLSASPSSRRNPLVVPHLDCIALPASIDFPHILRAV